MSKLRRFVVTNLVATLALSILPSARIAAEPQLTQEEVPSWASKQWSTDSRLIIVDMTKRVQTNVEQPTHNGHAPINQFSNFLKYPTAAYKDVVRMNVDTLYSFAWLDLSKEPMILSVPDTNDRYYLMPVLDAWTNVFVSPGKRTAGTKAGQFAIVGPNWKGELPEGVKELRSPTNTAMIAGRTQADGPADYEAVNAIQREYKLTPLSAFDKPYTPSKGVVDPNIDTKTPPVEQVGKMDAATFFSTLATLLKSNPPPAADAPDCATCQDRHRSRPGLRHEQTRPGHSEGAREIRPSSPGKTTGGGEEDGETHQWLERAAHEPRQFRHRLWSPGSRGPGWSWSESAPGCYLSIGIPGRRWQTAHRYELLCPPLR